MQRFGAKTNGREVGERFGEMIWGRVGKWVLFQTTP